MLKASLLQVISVVIYAMILIIGIKNKYPLKKHIFYFLSFFYIIAVFSVTMFPMPVTRIDIELIRESSALKNNFIPFRDILGIISSNNKHNILRQLGGNILMLIPFGCLIPLVLKNSFNTKKVLVLGLIFSLTIELLQFLVSALIGVTYRITDIDDVILNMTGVIIGYFLFRTSIMVKLVDNKILKSN